jgi:hypothetical protein
MNILPFVIIFVHWIMLLFYPRFSKKQLWKTLIFACCYTVPLLAEGIEFAQKMQYQLDYSKLLSVLVIMTFLFHPAVWLICLVWNIVDIVKNNKCEREDAERESMRLWWQLLLTIIYMVVFLVTSFPPIIGIGC